MCVTTLEDRSRLLSELLHLLVHDKTLTHINLRKMSSRAELPKKRPLRRKVSVKRLPFRRGWTTITSSKSAAQRRRLAWIAVGNIPKRGKDNDV